MKRRLLARVLAPVMALVLTLGVAPRTASAIELSDGAFYVDANAEAGLNGRITVDIAESNDGYTGTLYLPGDAIVDDLGLSWDGENTTVTVSDTSYESGEAPIPQSGQTMTYAVTANGSTANLTLSTLQGSADVDALFINIDESMGTIDAMNGDDAHDTMCYGTFTLGSTHYMTIKGRGKSSWSYCDKKPYNITVFKDGTYEKKDKNCSLIDGVASKQWSILANAKDPSLIRNKIGYDLAYNFGIGLPSKFIDVWMNGSYRGNYLLTPKNDYLTPKNGYLVEIDNEDDVDQFTLSESPRFTVKEMGDNVTVEDVQNYVSQAWNALKNTSSEEYLNYFDIDSWAKMYLLHEFYKDYDISIGSKFFMKDDAFDDSKLVAGPIWDLDLTLGRTNQTHLGIDNANYNENSAGGWYIDSIKGSWGNTNTPFFQWLGKHQSFMKRVYELYNEVSANGDTYKDMLYSTLDNYSYQRAYIENSALMDAVRWPDMVANAKNFRVTQNSITFGNDAYAVTYQKTSNWSASTDNLGVYLNKRLSFLADKLTVALPVAGAITGETSVEEGTSLALTADCAASTYQWQSSEDGETWTDISGATSQTYSTTADADMNGLFVRYVATNSATAAINTSRVAKATPSASASSDPVQLAVAPSTHVPSSLNNVQLYIDANAELGLNGKVDISLTKSGGTFSGTIYLPGGADADNLKLSWETGLQLTVNGASYSSGEAPIPAVGNTTTYVITADDGTANLTLKTLQGSPSVRAMFLNIDESLGTITAMNSDANHNTSCKGSVTLGSTTYYMTMKGRGNSTWREFDKKPYNITTMKDDTYADKKKTKLIAGVEAKSWSILANAKDPTCLRNKIGYDIANVLGIGLPSESIDVWMNGQYLGNYLLTPKNDYQAPKNGYMVELDNSQDDDQFTLSGSPLFTVKDMADGLTVNDVKNSVSPAWDAVKNTSSEAYLDYFDVDSFAKAYLLQEIYKDVDAYAGSKFFTKATMDSDSKLVAGPIWDLDGTMGRVSTSYVSISDRATAERSGGAWYIDSISEYNTPFYQWLGKHQSFMKRVYQLYNAHKSDLSGSDGMLNDLQEQRELIAASAEMNFARWPQYMVNTEHFSITQNTATYSTGTYAVTYKKTDSWSAFTDNFAEYLRVRLMYLSDKLTVAPPAPMTISGETAVDVDASLTLTADCSADAYQWQMSEDGSTWTDIAGAASKTYATKATSDMDGLYIRYIATKNGSIIDTSRVAKAAASASTTSEPVQLTVNVGEHVHNYSIVVVTEPTCQHGGYTTHTCTCGDSYTDSETDPIDHVYEKGTCKFCGADDPDYTPDPEPACVYKTTVSLSEGDLILSLGGQEAGEFTFARSGSNWTIQATDGRYLGFSNNAFAYSTTPFAWSYSNGAFTTSVTTTSQSSGWGGWWGGWWGGGNSTTITTYYLVYSGGRFSTSTSSSGSNASFLVQVSSMTHTFGDWKQASGEQHSHTCTKCGAVETEDCSYGADHKCATCGRVDPHLVYVTATFVTGEGASVAPQAQTVIAGEGLIEKPADDPTRVGYTFGGWYAQGSESAFDFTAPLQQDVTLTAKWNVCDHHFEDGMCTICGAKDPNAVSTCEGDKKVSLEEGTLKFSLNSVELGEFTFAKSGSNWTIQASDGRYLGFSNNSFAYSTTPFAWSYSNGAFTTSVTTTSQSSGWGGWWGGWWGGGNSTTTTTYYLVYSGGGFATSTSSNGSSATFSKHVVSDTHSFGAWTQTANETHTRICEVCGETESGNCSEHYGADHYCTVCGRFDPNAVSVTANVNVTSQTSQSSGWGGWWNWWGGGSSTTTYTATITAEAKGTSVTSVQYSTNNSSWTTGTSYSSSSNITLLYVRVNTPAGTYNFVYRQGQGTQPTN